MFFRYLGDGFKLPTRNSEEPKESTPGTISASL